MPLTEKQVRADATELVNDMVDEFLVRKLSPMQQKERIEDFKRILEDASKICGIMLRDHQMPTIH